MLSTINVYIHTYKRIKPKGITTVVLFSRALKFKAIRTSENTSCNKFGVNKTNK